jgi:hypothetical protein
MKFKTVYLPENDNMKEIYRNFMSTYYYLLFNNKINRYKKKLDKIYGNKAEMYYDFFNDHFIKTQNVLFFTLYNMLPIEFLPFPQRYLYLKYPIISFTNDKMKPKYYSSEKVTLNSEYIGKNVHDIDLLWKSYTQSETNKIKKIKEINDMIKMEKQHKYDMFQFLFNIKYIRKLDKDFFNNKTLFLYRHMPIICEDFKFNFENNSVELNRYYVKNLSGNYDMKNEKKIILLKNIRFLSIYANITRQHIFDCFEYDTIKKGTYLYNHKNTKDMVRENYLPAWYTLTPFIKIHDPLNITPEIKYKTEEFITIGDIKVLNLSTNILLYNKLISKKKLDIFNCFYNITDNIDYCDNDFIDPNKSTDSINYNKKQALLLIIYKNMQHIVYNINFVQFLKLLNIHSYFNMLSLAKLKNNETKILGEEILINYNYDFKKTKIKVVTPYTTDITTFKNYNKKYEKIYL